MPNRPGFITVAYATGPREIPLTPDTMDTMTKFFEQREDGVFYFSNAKQRKALGL